MKKWSLQQVVLLASLAFLFSDVFTEAGFLYALLSAVLLPLGLSPFTNELLFGMWTMVVPVAAILAPRAGSAVLAEVLAALTEILHGSYLGPSVLISGVIQDLGGESGFSAIRYRRYDTLMLPYSAIRMTIFGYVYEYSKLGYGSYGLGMNIVLVSVRLVFTYFLGIFLTKIIL